MTMTIETSRYEFAHGHKPRGTGFWMFELRIPGQDWMVLPAPAMTYGKAAAMMRKTAKSLGATQLRVCS